MADLGIAITMSFALTNWKALTGFASVTTITVPAFWPTKWVLVS